MSKQYGRGDVIAARFEVRELLAESPLGMSYRVAEGGSTAHLLVIHPAIVEKAGSAGLARALKRARGLEVSNILAVQELVESDEAACFVFEDFQGQTLRQFINEQKVEGRHLEAKGAAQIVGRLLSGLEVCHMRSCLLYTSPSPRDLSTSRMPSSA